MEQRRNQRGNYSRSTAPLDVINFPRRYGEYILRDRAAVLSSIRAQTRITVVLRKGPDGRLNGEAEFKGKPQALDAARALFLKAVEEARKHELKDLDLLVEQDAIKVTSFVLPDDSPVPHGTNHVRQLRGIHQIGSYHWDIKQKCIVIPGRLRSVKGLPTLPLLLGGEEYASENPQKVQFDGETRYKQSNAMELGLHAVQYLNEKFNWHDIQLFTVRYT